MEKDHVLHEMLIIFNENDENADHVLREKILPV